MDLRRSLNLVTELLRETPHFADLIGRDGLPCRVWKNPSKAEFGYAIAQGKDASGLRGLLTAHDLYVWQSNNLLHGDFERDMGFEGMRVALRQGAIQLNDETVAQPEHFPFIFLDLDAAKEQDIEERRALVEEWLATNPRVRRLYPAGFKTIWYS